MKDKEGHCWKWRARISYDGGKHFLGYFDDERAAAEAYDCAAINLWGDEDVSAAASFVNDGCPGLWSTNGMWVRELKRGF